MSASVVVGQPASGPCLRPSRLPSERVRLASSYLSLQGLVGRQEIQDALEGESRIVSVGDAVSVTVRHTTLSLPVLRVYDEATGAASLQADLGDSTQSTVLIDRLIRRHSSGMSAIPLCGLASPAADLARRVSDSAARTRQLRSLGLPASSFIVLHGSPGAGKHAVISSALSSLASHSTFELHVSRALADADAQLHGELAATASTHTDDVIGWALLAAPSVIVVRGLDLLRAPPPGAHDAAEASVANVAQRLARALDAVSEHHVVFVGTSEAPLAALAAPLRTAISETNAITVAPPTEPERADILRELIPNAHNIDFSRLAKVTHGFTRRDLTSACRAAHLSGPPSHAELELAVWQQRPGEYAASDEANAVKWESIGGYQEVKRELRQLVDWPLLHADTMKRLAVSPPAGALLFGPPGCGKTMLVRALASSTPLPFFHVGPADIFNKYLGESEASVRRLFSRARASSPCVIIIDELDSIAARRGLDDNDSNDGSGGVSERVLSQLLNEMDGISGSAGRGGVFVIGVTNRPDKVDDALLRPGRFDRLVHVGMPTKSDIADVLRVAAARAPLDATDADFDGIASRMNGASAADAVAAVRAAVLATVIHGGKERLTAGDVADAWAALERQRIDVAEYITVNTAFARQRATIA